MDNKEESDKIPFMLMEQIGINEQLKEELDKKDKIIDILLNEVAKDGTPTEFEYRKKRILEICKEKVEDK